MKLSNVYQQVSEKLDIPPAVVKLAYESYWEFIREHIKSLPLKEDLSDEEFEKLRTNFNIPSIGKLSCTLERYKSIKRKYAYIRKLRNGSLERENSN